MQTDLDYPQRQAARCRRLAAGVDTETSRKLIAMAEEYERRAEAGRWSALTT